MIQALSLVVAVGFQSDGVAAGNKAISDMIALYYRANAIQGTILKTQSAQGHVATVKSALQIDRTKHRVFLRQDLVSQSVQRSWLVTGDGKVFSYEEPNGAALTTGHRLVERMVMNGKPLTEKDIYVIASKSINERNVALDVAFGRNEDLTYLKSQIVKVSGSRADKIGEEDVRVVMGQWRDSPISKANYPFEMWIGPKGELRRFVTQENVVASATTFNPKGGNQQFETIKVTTKWDVALETDGKLDESLFKVAL